MTITNSALVAIALGIFLTLHLRSNVAERTAALRHGAELVAKASRLHIETAGAKTALLEANTLALSLSQVVAPYQIKLFSWTEDERRNSLTNNRIQKLIQGRHEILSTQAGQQYVYTVAIRADVSHHSEPIGAIEVAIDLSSAKPTTQDERTLMFFVALGAILMIFVTQLFLFRYLVTHPIAKLLTGVGDVAHGDLSQVLLAEREDEIGDLAARFNEMTFSLRESQSQTKRHNKARMDLEHRLFQTEKLATIGQIAAEIAHEVGTPLNVISGRAKGIIRKSSGQSAVLKNARIIAEQTARITRIIQRLLDFSRRKVGVEENVPMHINSLVEETLEFLESKLAAVHVKHRLNTDDQLPVVQGNPDQILQVLTNLILNAAEAMNGGGGQLSVETAAVIRRRPGLEIAPEVSAVIVTVCDSGPGIPLRDRDKVFEPFYSSKTRIGGTGLGLAVVHSIVKAHDGWIELSDSPHGGTCFSVYLPADS